MTTFSIDPRGPSHRDDTVSSLIRQTYCVGFAFIFTVKVHLDVSKFSEKQQPFQHFSEATHCFSILQIQQRLKMATWSNIDSFFENMEQHQDVNQIVAVNDQIEEKQEIDLSQGLHQRKKRKKRGKKRKNVQSKSLIERPIREQKYEYLDHTADVQLHSWGTDMKEAFEMVAIAMFGYMTELETVEYRKSFEITAEGHDLNSLLFHFLDELLVAFSCEEYLLFKDIEITEFDRDQWTITAVGYGECMDLNKHPQGTEVKAITYSAMQIKETKDKCECLVVVDI